MYSQEVYIKALREDGTWCVLMSIRSRRLPFSADLLLHRWDERSEFKTFVSCMMRTLPFSGKDKRNVARIGGNETEAPSDQSSAVIFNGLV